MAQICKATAVFPECLNVAVCAMLPSQDRCLERTPQEHVKLLSSLKAKVTIHGQQAGADLSPSLSKGASLNRKAAGEPHSSRSPTPPSTAHTGRNEKARIPTSPLPERNKRRKDPHRVGRHHPMPTAGAPAFHALSRGSGHGAPVPSCPHSALAPLPGGARGSPGGRRRRSGRLPGRGAAPHPAAART